MADPPPAPGITGWWLEEIAGSVGGMSLRRYTALSKEECGALKRIALLWSGVLVLLIVLISVAQKLMHLHDRLDIFRSVSLLLTVPLSAWLARRIFVRCWPLLSAAADQNAARRRASERSRATPR